MESELHEQNYSTHLSSFFFVRSISLTGFWMTRKRSFQKLRVQQKALTWCHRVWWKSELFKLGSIYFWNFARKLWTGFVFLCSSFPHQPSHTRALSMIAAFSCVPNKASTSGKKHKRTARTAALLQTYLLFSTMFPSFKSLCTIFFCKIHNSITWAKA